MFNNLKDLVLADRILFTKLTNLLTTLEKCFHFLLNFTSLLNLQWLVKRGKRES